MCVKDKCDVVDARYKKFENILQPLESMHITLLNKVFSSKEYDEHTTMQEHVDNVERESTHEHPSFFVGEIEITAKEMEDGIDGGETSFGSYPKEAHK